MQVATISRFLSTPHLKTCTIQIVWFVSGPCNFSHANLTQLGPNLGEAHRSFSGKDWDDIKTILLTKFG